MSQYQRYRDYELSEGVTVRQLQLKLLEIFLYFKKICEENNLTACDERYIIMSTNDSETAYDEFVGKGEDVRDVNEISLLMVMLRKDEILSESKSWELMYNGKFMQ